jgi:hypothetical protein
VKVREHAATVPVWLCISLLACFSAGCGGQDEASSANAHDGSVSPIRALEPTFRVFRRSQQRADVIPSTLVPRSVAKAVGLGPETTRRARSYRRKSIYAALSSQLACTYSAYHPVGNCWPIATVQHGLAFASSICGLGTRKDESVIYGIVPDAVQSVRIPRNSRRDQTVPVIGNVFVASISSEPPLPRRLFLLESDKRIARPTGIPADVARRGCATRGPAGLSPPPGR